MATLHFNGASGGDGLNALNYVELTAPVDGDDIVILDTASTSPFFIAPLTPLFLITISGETALNTIEVVLGATDTSGTGQTDNLSANAVHAYAGVWVFGGAYGVIDGLGFAISKAIVGGLPPVHLVFTRDESSDPITEDTIAPGESHTYHATIRNEDESIVGEPWDLPVTAEEGGGTTIIVNNVTSISL